MSIELDGRSLARLCSQRDRLAEEELYTKYAAKVYTLLIRYLGDEDKAKDLMQETLIQALDKIQTFKYIGQGSLYGWIRRIAINKALNYIKRQRWSPYLRKSCWNGYRNCRMSGGLFLICTA